MNSGKLSIGGQLPRDTPNAAAHETLLLKATLVLLSPLEMGSNDLEKLTDPGLTKTGS
jgi:hypothetical protein